MNPIEPGFYFVKRKVPLDYKWPNEPTVGRYIVEKENEESIGYWSILGRAGLYMTEELVVLQRIAD